jgi:hypothetical protein
MSAAKQLTGMRGVYLVAAELSRLGFIASPTSRSAIGADLLVTDQRCQNAFTVQVKTNASTFGFWLLSEKARSMVSPQYIYVFVNLRRRKDVDIPEFFIVPSSVVAAKMESGTATTGSKWHSFSLADAKQYQGNWAAFGQAVASDPTESADAPESLPPEAN